MDWLRRLFKMHVHQWGAPQHIVIDPRIFVSKDGYTTIEMRGREFDVQWCKCGKYRHVTH